MSEAVTELRPTVGLVPVSSLIFVVIVAIWAAYLVQHWARRREDAAATRSVDGFTEAMRVLAGLIDHQIIINVIDRHVSLVL